MAQQRLESTESGQGQRERVKEEVGFLQLYAPNAMAGLEKKSNTLPLASLL
jgi:hypothetical protein